MIITTADAFDQKEEEVITRSGFDYFEILTLRASLCI